MKNEEKRLSKAREDEKLGVITTVKRVSGVYTNSKTILQLETSRYEWKIVNTNIND